MTTPDRALGEDVETLVSPYGGRLVDLLVKGEDRAETIQRANTLPSMRLSPRSLCDLEMLATGGFSPLDRFMGQADYAGVLERMCLADGTLFPIPVTLPVGDDDDVRRGDDVALRDMGCELVAVMRVEEAFKWDPLIEAQRVYGTTDVRHPLVAEMMFWGRTYISGPLKVVNVPRCYDFVELCRTPAEVRRLLRQMGCGNVVAFMAWHPAHRAQEEFMRQMAAQIGGALLLQPVVDFARAGDGGQYARVRAWKAFVEASCNERRVLLNLLPLATRMAGPREAVWHAIIHRNYGGNHFIVGRDHAAAGENSAGRPFYEPSSAQDLLARLAPEVGVTILPITEPEAMAPPMPVSPPPDEQGFCVWFTGLSGAGKSTIARILARRLLERGREVTLLDGDVVRTHLSKGLGFSKQDRDSNILRIAFVAAEIVRHGGVAVCAAVSPYRAARNRSRSMVGADHFIEVYVDTPLEVCEQRDRKGIYAKARRGEIKGLTGIDDPYEPPVNPEIVLATMCMPETNVQEIVDYLTGKGFLRP